MYRIVTLFILGILGTTTAKAQDAKTRDYYSAYNICSPSAQNQTMKNCNYAQMVEGYYTTCMKQNGFGESDEITDKARYAEYLKSYKQCSAIANGAAQQQCNFGSVYQNYYNKCMSQYGYNNSGERTGPSQAGTSDQEDIQKTEPSAPPAKVYEKYKNENGVKKFFDSIL